MASKDDLWLVDFGDPHPGEPGLHRPALIVGPPQTFGPGFPYVIVSPMTRTDRGLSLHVEVPATVATGLKQTSFVQCELIRTINKKRLIRPLGVIDAVTSERVSRILKTLLDH